METATNKFRFELRNERGNTLETSKSTKSRIHVSAESREDMKMENPK